MSHIHEEFHVSDAKGNSHLVQVWRKSINTSNLDGSASLQGLPHYKLKDGSTLNTDDGKSFVHYRTNEKLTKVGA